MSILSPDEIFHEKVLLYVTDVALNLVKSGKGLKGFYPLIGTYIAHGLYGVADAIKERFQSVDQLILYIKMIFLKNTVAYK